MKASEAKQKSLVPRHVVVVHASLEVAHREEVADTVDTLVLDTQAAASSLVVVDNLVVERIHLAASLLVEAYICLSHQSHLLAYSLRSRRVSENHSIVRQKVELLDPLPRFLQILHGRKKYHFFCCGPIASLVFLHNAQKAR